MPFFRRAVELGVNFFDTADVYSLGVSQEITGKAVREFASRDEAVVASKVRMRMGPGPNRGGLSRKHIIQSCEASLKRLGVERIDLYRIHRADPNTPVEETLAALDQLVRQGKVLYVGASSSPLARGLLTGKRRRGSHDTSRRDEADARLTGELCDHENDWDECAALKAPYRPHGVRGWLGGPVRQPGMEQLRGLSRN